ncbi:MAG: hypothetical protein QM749_02115 [Aquabacterium sp.]
MTFDSQTIALIAIAVGFVGMAWAVFWPVRAQPGSNPISTHWDMVYVDEEGVMQFTMVRVLKVNPATRRMTAWCSSSGVERVFKLTKIVKATDVRSGARINIARLMDKPAGVDNGPVDKAEAADSQHGDAGTWWRTSRLGMH